MFKNIYSSEGRIRRLEYGLTIIISGLINGIFAVLFSGMPVVLIIPSFILGMGVLFQGAKRCHDLGRSGLWQFIPLYPIVMLFAPGQRGENEYGINPKERIH